jgi:hypothetical protein
MKAYFDSLNIAEKQLAAEPRDEAAIIHSARYLYFLWRAHNHNLWVYSLPEDIKSAETLIAQMARARNPSEVARYS